MTAWAEVELGDVCEFRYGKSLPAAKRDGGRYPVYGSNGIVGRHSLAITDGPTIVIGRKGSFGEVSYSPEPAWPIDTAYYVDGTATSADLKWLSYRLARLGLTDLNKSAAVPGLNREDAYRQKLLLPPLDEQRRIAAILDQADAIRAKRRQVLTHLDSLTQSIFHDMFGDGAPSVPLGTLVDFYSGGTPSKAITDYWNGDLPWFSAKDLKALDLWDSQDHIARRVPAETNLRLLPPNTIALVVRGMILAHTIPVANLRVSATINQDLKALIPKVRINADFLTAALRARENWLLARVSTAAHGTKKLESTVLTSIPIPRLSETHEEEFAHRMKRVRSVRELQRRASVAGDEFFASLQSRAFRGEL